MHSVGKGVFVRKTIRNVVDLDKWGINLSLLCLIHCLVTPFILMSLPIMARYYLAHPWFHWVMAILIVPVGVRAFYAGYLLHKNLRVFYFGIPGLLAIGIVPVFFHSVLNFYTEIAIMVAGGSSLIVAHLMNRRSCFKAVTSRDPL